MAERDHFSAKLAGQTPRYTAGSRYKRLRNQVTAMIRKAKSSYNCRVIEEIFNDPKNSWKAIKKVLPKKSTTPQPSASIDPIIVDGKTTTDALTTENGFCTYFSTVVGKLLSNIPALNGNQLSAEACLNNSIQYLFSLKPVSAAFVNRQLRLLNTSKGTGLDGIPARLLKDAAPSISAPITAIINLSISSAVVRRNGNIARVVPLCNDGDKKCMDNYRPIAVLLVASKILERAVQVQLLQHLDKSNQLSPFQCGFRKNHSTQDAVTYLTDCIRKGIDEGCVTAAVSVDFRKAFDSVNHQLVLKKLPGYGIQNQELRRFENYLTYPCQCVVYGSAQSASQQITSGVPQGSILGPILFSIYINDLPNCLLQSQILLYADDAVLFYADSNIGKISTVLNKDLKQLQSWTYHNKLCIHPVKSEYVIFGTQQRIASATLSDGPFSLFLGEKPINQAQHYKYHAVLIDANLNFKQHVDKLLVKISKRIGVLGRIRNNLTVDSAN